MSLIALTYIAADLIVLAALIGILYAPRHSRRDLMATYIGVNVGVLTVTLLPSTADVVIGLGLGLLGVLSIIRLRSTELAQHEIAYFFAALVLGLLGGIQTAPIEMVATLMGTVVTALWIGDHPTLIHRNRHQVAVLDHVIVGEAVLITHLEHTLGGQVSSMGVQCLDLVDGTTTIDIRFRAPCHTSAELETTTAFDDIALAAQPVVKPISAVARKAQTAQPWNGMRLDTAQADSHPESVEAQPSIMTSAVQYVTRFSSQVALSTVVAPR